MGNFPNALSRPFTDMFGDYTSVLDAIPAGLHGAIFNYSCSVDLSAYFQNALNWYKRVWVPAGGYVFSGLQLNNEGQILHGEGRTLVKCAKSANAPMISIQANYAGIRGLSLFGNYDTFNNGSNWFPGSAPAFADTTDGIVIGAPGLEGIEAIVNTSGTAVTWVSGTKFTYIVPGLQIQINGAVFTVASVGSSTTLTLISSAGTLTGASAYIPAVFNWFLEDALVYHMGRDGINWQDGPSPSI